MKEAALLTQAERWAGWALAVLGMLLVAGSCSPGVAEALPAAFGASAGVLGAILGSHVQAQASSRQRQAEIAAEAARRQAEERQAARAAAVERRLEQRRLYLPQLRTAVAECVALWSADAPPGREGSQAHIQDAADRFHKKSEAARALEAQVYDPELANTLALLREEMREGGYCGDPRALQTMERMRRGVNRRIDELLSGEDLVE